MSHISLMVFISYVKNDLDRFSNRKWAVYRSRRSFPIWKSLIGWFSNRKWAVHRSWPSFSYSEVDQRASFKKEMSSFSRMALISHTFSFGIHRGAMRRKMAILKGGNSVCRDTFFSDISFYLHKEFPSRQTKGGDVIENVDFPKRKQRLQGYKILQRSHSTYTKITTLTICEDLSLTKCQSFLLKTLTTCEEFI